MTVAQSPRDRYLLVRLSNALLLSILLHGVALALLLFARQLAAVNPAATTLLDVDVVTLPPLAAAPPPPVPRAPPQPEPPPAALLDRQIVSPPDAGRAEPPKETRLLSDQDNTAERETVKRGQGGGGQEAAEPAPPPPPQPAREVSRSEPRIANPPPADAGAPNRAGERLARAPGLDALLPSARQMAREGYIPPAADIGAAPTPGAAAGPSERRDVLRYADARRPGAGLRGTLDFLPDVHEGDVTMLNTKAELFAPFVRRVAQRVFQNQIISLRREVGQIGVNAQEMVTVEAIMSRAGNLLSVRTTDRSSTSATGLDRHLQRACQQAFFDYNPPPGAESGDGNIHFLFRTQLQVFAGPGGAPSFGALLMAGLL